MVELELDVDLKKFQKKIINEGTNYDKKFLCILASRQIGKSFALRVLSLLYLSEFKSFIGYVTLTNKLGKLFFSEIVSSLPKQLIKYANSVDLTIELINKSKMQFFSIESIENVRGFSLTHLIVDETAFAKEYTPNGQNIYQNILSPLVDARGKKVIFCSTPWIKSGLFYESYVKSIEDKINWGLVKATIYDDETKDPGWIESKRHELTDKVFKTEYCCEFIDENANSFFQDFTKQFDYTEDYLFEDLTVGVDFSSVGSDETILTFMNAGRKVKQFLITGTLDEKYNKLSELLNKHSDKIKKGYIEKNSIGTVMYNEIKKKLNENVKYKIVEFITTNKSKTDILNFLQNSISNNNIHFSIGDKELLSQFNTFEYSVNPNTKNITYSASPGNHDDRIMSLALCNWCYKDLDRDISIFSY